jgi:Outer membrane efflux protein
MKAKCAQALRRLALPTGALLLAGCTAFSPDGGFAPVQQAARDRLGKELVLARSEADLDTIDKRVAELLAQPLSADAAVQIALLNNRGLQASFQQLGLTEAEVVQSGRLPNPAFVFGRKTRGDEVELEYFLAFNIARLIALPLINEVEARRFEQVKGATVLAMLGLAADTRKAWIAAVAADESVRYMRQVLEAAEASAELARRMAAVGNFNALQRAREQSFQADAALNVARAVNAQRATRERLTRLMGLWGQQAKFTLPERLPALPDEPTDQPNIERMAMVKRLDVQGAKLAAEQTAKNLNLTKTTRFVNLLELGLSRKTFNEGPSERGWEIAIELPIFDWGDARIAQAEAIYMQSLHRAAETAVNARSEVREAYGGYRAAYEIARQYRDQIVPLRQQIAEQNLLRYNGMLIGVFELLADARVQITSVNSAIEALRDFWIAQADLEMAMVGKPGAPIAIGGAAAPAAAADGGPGH